MSEAGEMRFKPVGDMRQAEDYYNFCIEWQEACGRLLMASDRTREKGEAKLADAEARRAWVRKREVEESARAKKRAGGKRTDASATCEDDRDLAVEPFVPGNGGCLPRQRTVAKDKSNAWIWNGELFTKRV